MANAKESSGGSASRDAGSASREEHSNAAGRFRTLPEMVRVDFEDGSAVIGPASEITLSARSVSVTAGDIIDIACKIFPKLCGGGGGGGGGGSGCYTIILPDGTKITICPPGAGTLIA